MSKVKTKKDIIFNENSFDIIRLISAILIVVGHISIHLNYKFPFIINQLQIRWIGLVCLFSISGYLIAASFDRCKSKKEYLIKRFFRLYPALWIAFLVSFFCVIFIGPKYSLPDLIKWIVAQVTAFQFYTPQGLKTYGVGNPNGSLWTISLEIQMYFFIMFTWNFFKRKSTKEWIFVILFFTLLNAIFPFLKGLIPNIIFKIINVSFIPYAYFFIIGMFLYAKKDSIIRLIVDNFYYILLIYIFWGIVNDQVFKFSIGTYTDVLTGTLLSICTIGAAYRFGEHKLKNDYSYSIYLYHMIVINFLVIIGINGTLMSVIITFAVTIVLSFLSFHFIEKPSMKMVKKIKFY